MSQRQTWDVGRFFQTLTYFEIIPVIGSISWLRDMILGKQNQNPNQPKIPQIGKILVVGGTNNLGQQVVKYLREYNYAVRVLVSDIERAKSIWGDKVEYYEGDFTISGSLTSAVMAEVKAIICTLENLPEAELNQGIKNLAQLAEESAKQLRETTIFDFTQATEDLKATWGAVDDVVMGGVSASNIRLVNNVALFSGNVSTANSGGFASVRNRNFEPSLDLSAYEGIHLRVKGDGKRYKFIMRAQGNWDGISYCYSFDTIYNMWLNFYIPFAELRPVFRAKTLTNAEAFDASQTYSMQLMLSKFEYDGELNPKFDPGAFQLQVESIQAYGKQETPKLILVSSTAIEGIEEAIGETGVEYTIIAPSNLMDKTLVKLLSEV